MVLTRITDPGPAVLAELDEPVQQIHEKQLGHLSEVHLEYLIKLLEKVRRD